MNDADVTVLDKVLEVLKGGREVSTAELSHLTAKLTNIIWRLRKEGYLIESRRIGKAGAVYRYKGRRRVRR